MRLALANEDRLLALVPIDNEMSIGEDGWVRIAPYGDSLKVRTIKDPATGALINQQFTQRLTMANATELAAKANSLWGKIKRFRVGIPIYRGHPDLGQHSPLVVGAYRSAKVEELGVLAELSAREDGLYGRPVLHRAGQVAVENDGLKWFSPFWWVRIVGQDGDKTIVEPHELISAGLTARPNINGGDALTNQQDIMNRELLIKLLTLANDATDQQIEAAIVKLQADLKAGADALANEKSEREKAVAKVAELEPLAAKVTTLEAAITERTTALTNERARGDKLELDRAMADGRLTAATRPEWEQALANETTREAKLVELDALKPTLPRGSFTGGLGARKGAPDAKAAGQQVISLANERLANFGGDWTRAFNDVRKTHPALFENMQKPAAQ